MFIRSTLTFALATLLATPLAAQGQPRHGGPWMGRRPEAGPMMMMRGLHLTEAQKADMKALATKHREAMKPKQQVAKAAQKALHEAMINPATTTEQLKALHDKAGQAQFELALGRRAMMQASLALLTPEQKAKAEQMRTERPNRGGNGRRHGMPPQGPAPEKK